MAKFSHMPSYTRLMRYFPLLALLGTLFFLLPSFLPAPGLEDEVLTYANRFRESNGLPDLVMRKDLNRIARRHSEDMAKGREGFGHGGFEQRQKEVEHILPFHSMAENVAYGARSGLEAIALWKNSGAHRRNLLGNYKYTGIGTARDRKGNIYFTQIFVR